jgi:hypothetical protein
MEEYLEDILRKIGVREKKVMDFGAMQMKRLGYFLSTIEPNLK